MTFSEKERLHILGVKGFISDSVKSMRSYNRWGFHDERVWDNLFLTGGAIASVIQDEIPKDWDLYFTDRSSMETVKKYLSLPSVESHIKDCDPSYKDSFGQNGKMITANAITMSYGDWSFITMIYGTPQEIKSTFDYVHCTPHYSFKEDKLYISPVQYRACVEKKLIVNNESSLKQYRESKFLERGYTRQIHSP